MDPGDDALLSDLLDGRLDPAAEAALRRRMVGEPELAEAWDELRRLREGLRTLPGPAVPSSFADRVRARIDDEERAAVSARRRSLVPYGAAAVVAIGLGLGAYALAIRGQTDRALRDAAEEPVEAPVAESTGDEAWRVMERPALEGVPAGAPPPPAAGPPAGPPVESYGDPGMTGFGSPAPAEPSGPPPAARGPIGSVPPGLRPPSDAPRPVPAPVPVTAPSLPPGAGRGGAGAAPASPGAPAGARLPEGLPPIQPVEGSPAGPDDPRFRDGVDEVLTVSASDLEEGRALLFLALDDVRAKKAAAADAAAAEDDEKAPETSPPASPAPAPPLGAPAAGASPPPEKEAPDEEAAPEAPAPPAAAGADAAGSGKRAEPRRPVLGTVLLTLTDAQLETLRTRLAVDASNGALADKAPPPPPPARKPAEGADRRAAGPVVVRVLFVGR